MCVRKARNKLHENCKQLYQPSFKLSLAWRICKGDDNAGTDERTASRASFFRPIASSRISLRPLSKYVWLYSAGDEKP
jgi:hypothetical protein